MKYIYIILSGLVMITSCDSKQSVDAHAGHNHEEHASHEGHDDAESQGTESQISEQAIKNMGLVIEEIDSSDYTIYAPVPAYLSNHPLSMQPVYAPFSGRVQDIKLEPGQYLKPGELITTIIRDPIKRLELRMVGDILTPASEEYHSAVASLRSSLKSLDVLRTELARLNKFKDDEDGLMIVPQKDLVDLRYAILKKTQDLSNDRAKLKFHGFSKAEIENLEKGGEVGSSPNLWLNALKQNNIWGDKSSDLFDTLPKKLQANHWTVAAVGELAAEGLISNDLVNYLKKSSSASIYFLEIASMLQEGHSLTDIQNLQEMGGLEKIIQIKATNNKSGWDLGKIHIKPGQVVSKGDTLFNLIDPTKMLLKAKPTGSEFVNINNAIKNSYSIAASPLVPNSSIQLKGLYIAKVLGEDNSAPVVFIPTKNSLLSHLQVDGVDYRNWNLRAGDKYILKVPIRKLKDVIVLPSEAVLDHGPDKIVFVREGTEFIRRKVVIVYENDEVAVIGEGSELLPEEEMVTRGAFALQLALIAGTPEAVDPHAGHNH